MKKLTLAAAIASFGAAVPACAIESHAIQNVRGQPVFEFKFYSPADGVYAQLGDEELASEREWPRFEIDAIVKGGHYWAQMIMPKGNDGPAIMNIGASLVERNASALSPVVSGDYRTMVHLKVDGELNHPDYKDFSLHGLANFGYLQAEPHETVMNLPRGDVYDLVAAAIHELAHALGISTDGYEPQPYFPQFGSDLGMGVLMVDDHGRPARPDQPILCDFCDHPYDPEAFDVRAERGRVVGPNINEVLEGALPGVPVAMHAYWGDVRIYNPGMMSHLELKNAAMSHQLYRNYVGLMEADLAVLQDLGWTIDRRLMFGRSVYGSGLNIVNDRGYYARTPDGTAYVPGEYNRALLGMGLHVYGSHNDIRQVADLLSAGEGGAGIRIDGEGNTLRIDPGVRVHANGPDGNGVIFAYGRNHVLVHRGDIEALGTSGVGLRFDFGDNMIPNDGEYRGSYIHQVHEEPFGPAPELQGPLVGRADITGRVAGTEAAILASGNAYVGHINIMQGARIEGDIVSHYAQRDEAGALRLTTLSFGQKADADGHATGVGDPDFRMAYDGHIRGGNVSLALDGGATRLNGAHGVHDVAVAPGAELSGAAHYTLGEGGVFVNAGTVAPGNSIAAVRIDGNYRQTESGTLQIEFNPQGEHDVLAVSGSLDLAGTLELHPAEGWYDNAWRLEVAILPNGAGKTGEFDTVSAATTSPTLTFGAQARGDQRYVLTATRAADAYSRHGTNDNARAAGEALARAGNATPAEARPFFVALDFSAPDGSDVARALDQVSPQGYSAGLAASLLRERDVMESVLRGFGDGLRHAPGADWQAFAVAFGAKGRQDARSTMAGYDASTYGLAIGGGRRLASNPDLAVGVHLDIAQQSVSLASPLWGKGRTTAFGLGAQLQYRPDALEGMHAWGGLRLGVEHGSMDRKVGVRNYYAAHSADWTGHSASVEVGGGYRWRLSPAATAGPVFALNYARVSRPGLEESGPAATRLALESRHVDALRSSLGLGATLRHELANGGTLNSYAQITWDHEWLDREVVQTASFAAMPGSTFQSRNDVLPRNSVGLRAGLTWQRSERFSVGAGLGGRLGSGYTSLQGQVSLRWAF